MDDDRDFDAAVVEVQEANDEVIREFLLSRMRPRDTGVNTEGHATQVVEQPPQNQPAPPEMPYAVG